MSFFVAIDMLCTCRTISASFADAGAEGSIIATSRSGSVTASQQTPSHSKWSPEKSGMSDTPTTALPTTATPMRAVVLMEAPLSGQETGTGTTRLIDT